MNSSPLKILFAQDLCRIFITIFFQKFFIVLSCLLVVAAASPYTICKSTVCEKYGIDPIAARVEKSYTTGQKYGGYSGSASSSGANYGGYSGSSGSSFSGFNLNSIMELVNDPYYALEKSQDLLEQLNEGLPDALAKMDPSIKNDIKQVNNLVLEICDKAVANSKPTTINSYYSPEGVKTTCDFLKKHVPEISRGLDEPAVISNLIQKLAEFVKLSKEMADLFE